MPSPQFSDSKRKLLEKYFQQGVSQSGSIDEIRRHISGVPIPLSLSQQEVLLQARALNGKPSVFVECFAMHRSGVLDIPVLENCLAEIFRRHEIWRTSYDAKHGQMFQHVHAPEPSYKLPVIDLRSLAVPDREAAAIRIASEQASAGFDLENGPLVRSLLVQFEDRKFSLHMAAHQSVIDGISVFQIFPAELTKLYESFSAGRPSDLPQLPIQFADYAWWQRGQKVEDQLGYWEKRLAGNSPGLDWPSTSSRSWESTYRGAIHPFAWTQRLTDALRNFSHWQGVTLFSVLLAGFSALLHTYTGQDDIIVGTLSPSGRKRSEVQSLLGYFLNPVALRMRVRPDSSFEDLLREAKEVISGALTNDDVPLSQIAEKMRINAKAGDNPFFKVAISLGPDVAPLPGGWTQTYMDVGSGGSHWPLYIEFSDRVSGLIGRAQYNPDFIGISVLEGVLEDWKALLEKVCFQPDRRLSELAPHLIRKFL